MTHASLDAIPGAIPALAPKTDDAIDDAPHDAQDTAVGAPEVLNHTPGPTARAALAGVCPPEAGVSDARESPTSEESPRVAADRTVPALGGGGSWGSRATLGVIAAGAIAALFALGGPAPGEGEVAAVATFREPADAPHALPEIAHRRAAEAPATPAPSGSDFDWAGLAARPDPHALEAALAGREAAPASTAPARTPTARTPTARTPEGRSPDARTSRRGAASLVFDASAQTPTAPSAPPALPDRTVALPAAEPGPALREAAATKTAATQIAATRAAPVSPVRARLVASEPGAGVGGDRPAVASSAHPGAHAGNYAGDLASTAAPPTVATVDAAVLPDGDYLLTQGTTIAGVLETAIQSDLPGMIRAVTTRDVYSRTGRTRLVPAGSTLIGRYASGLRTGQRRVGVEWTRIERPDGIVVALDAPGTDALGRAGLGGDVDTHTFERLGAGFLFSVIGAGVALLDDGGDSRAERDLYRQSGDSLNRAAAIALEDSLEIPPTLHVDQGTRLTIFVARDLDFARALGAR